MLFDQLFPILSTKFLATFPTFMNRRTHTKLRKLSISRSSPPTTSHHTVMKKVENEMDLDFDVNLFMFILFSLFKLEFSKLIR